MYLSDTLFYFLSGKIMFESGVWMRVEGENKRKRGQRFTTSISVQFPKIRKYFSNVRLYESKGRGLSKIYKKLSRAKEPRFYIKRIAIHI